MSRSSAFVIASLVSLVSACTIDSLVGTRGSANGVSTPAAFTMTGQLQNSATLTWSAATSTHGAIASYKIYRNGSAYDTSTSTTYTDAKATSTSISDWTSAATIYAYGISAIDNAGNEGPQTNALSVWGYTNGASTWNNVNYSNTTLDFADTKGNPVGSAHDISVTASATLTNGYAQLPSGPPQTLDWGLELGAFNFVVIDLEPTHDQQTWSIGTVSRLPPNDDIYNNAAALLPGSYGPAPVVGKWATYKIPLTDLGMGTFECTGSITGTTLTVTSTASDSETTVQPGAFITGTGITANTTIVSGGKSPLGQPETYMVSASQNVSSTTIRGQRTNMSHFAITDTTTIAGNVFYMNNLGFTVN